MNQKGQVWGYLFMIGMVIIILALALAFPTKQIIESSRNASVGDTLGMDCDNSSISNFQKAACIATDVSLFYFIGTLIFLFGVVFTARRLVG